LTISSEDDADVRAPFPRYVGKSPPGGSVMEEDRASEFVSPFGRDTRPRSVEMGETATTMTRAMANAQIVENPLA
jgi:hypothetical protein